MEEFQDYLKSQTNLNNRSVRTYIRIMKRFLNTYELDSIENMNRFIKDIPQSKFVFFHWLNFKQREKDYALLLKTKTKPTKREGVYISKEVLEQICLAIENPKHKIVALIQFLTGIRAEDALLLRKANFHVFSDRLEIKVIGKGEVEHHVIILHDYRNPIIEYVNSKGDLPFLEEGNELVKVDTAYHYYYNSVKYVAEKLGYPNFRTHDFRRNLIDQTYDATKDIRVAQRVAAHAQTSTTLRYLKKKISKEEYRDVIKKVRS